MLALIGRSLITRAILAVAGILGLPSPRFFIAVTSLAACAAFYSRRTAIAVVLIGVTGLIAFGAFAIRNAGTPTADRPGPRSHPPAVLVTHGAHDGHRDAGMGRPR